MFINATQFVERSQFFNGQRLFASDLQELEAFNREMRWLHNQSLHQPGIGSGYVPTGKKGDRQVSVGPGYALDVFGREIVLTQTRTEQVPPVAADGHGKPVWFDLTVSYPLDTDLKASETREGICLPRGVVRLREEPIFCWVRLTQNENGQVQPDDQRLQQQILDGIKIVVARAEVFNCQLNRDLCIAQRRNARPPTQPYVACGHARPKWTKSEINERLTSFEATIDTSKARFQVTPCYTARIEEDTTAPPASALGLSFLRAFLILQIVDPLPNRFTVRALLRRTTDLGITPALLKGMPKAIALAFGSRKTAKTKRLALKEEQDLLSKLFDSHAPVVWLGVEG